MEATDAAEAGLEVGEWRAQEAAMARARQRAESGARMEERIAALREKLRLESPPRPRRRGAAAEADRRLVELQAGGNAEEALVLGMGDPARFMQEWEVQVPFAAWKGYRDKERYHRAVFTGVTTGVGPAERFFHGNLSKLGLFWPKFRPNFFMA